MWTAPPPTPPLKGRGLLFILLALLPIPAGAQALSCPIPRTIPRPFLERVPDDQEPVVRPVTGYTLALSWSPQFCQGREREERHAFQCRAGRFGFILHGLWPEADRAEPAWCAYAPRLPEAVIRENLCTTPSAQLIQHEWAKHGTCASTSPRDYFAAARKLYGKVSFPDMAALARRRTLTVVDLRQAFARANHWLPPDAVGVATTRADWLAEVKLCLDARFRPRACDAYDRGREPWQRLRIRPIGRS